MQPTMKRWVRNAWDVTRRALLVAGVAACGGGGDSSGPGTTGGGGSTPPPVVAIALSSSSLSLAPGGTQQLSATVSGTSNLGVSWTTANASVATVSGGLVTGVGPGTTTITATAAADPTKTATATVTVTAPVSISLSTASLSLLQGTTQQVNATVSGSTNTGVTWTTSNPLVATVSGGVISAIGIGTAVITATAIADTTKKGSASITVTAPNTGGGAPTITSGTPVVGISGAEDQTRVYRIVIPAGATRLDVVTTGSNGDVDLYLSRVANPTSSSQIACASEGEDSNERCSVNNPASGEWFVLLYGYSDYSGATLTATVTAGAAPTSGYTLSVSPVSQTIMVGTTTQYTVLIQRDAGFTGAVTLAVSGLPTGVTGTFSPNPSTGTSSTLTLSASSLASTGTSTFIVSGEATGLATRTAPGSITVTPSGGTGTGSYTLSVSPSSATLSAGSSTSAAVLVSRSGGFTGAVTLSASNLPTGVSASFSPSTIPSTSSTATLTLTASSSAPDGSSTAAIRGSASGLTDRTASLPVTVSSDPTLSQVTRIEVTPKSAVIYTGQTATLQARAYDANSNDITAQLLGTTSFFAWSIGNAAVLGQIPLIANGPNRQQAVVYAGSRNGTTAVTATLGGRTASTTIEVRVPTVLTLRSSGTGGGTLSATPDRTGYFWDDVVRVTPTPDAYSYFANWSSGCSGNTVPCQLTMSSDRTVGATFSPQPWVGLWGGTVTAVQERTSSGGGTCTWNVTFASAGSVTVTYPKNATTGVRTVSVRILSRATAPTGTPSRTGLTCNATNDPEDVTLTGPIGSNGSFSVTGRLSAFDLTVSSGGLGVGPNALGQIPVTLALVYNSTAGRSISGSLTTTTTAQPTLEPPRAP